MAFMSETLPPPRSGLNIAGAIDSMDPSYALELVNVFPSAKSPIVRSGYTILTDTGTTAQIFRMASLVLGTGAGKLVASSNHKLYEVSSGTASDITGATTPTADAWNTETFGYKLYLCNGADTVQVYDGTSVIDSTFSGVTLANLINVAAYNERLYFIEKNTLKFWYGNAQATGGSALTGYDLKFAFKNGGYLLFAGSWTNQLAQTSADLFFACSSEGEILFYNGSYPGDTAWAKVARFVIGKPLSYRSFIRVNNDIWVITEQGIVPISELFSPTPENALETVGVTINALISQYAAVIGFSSLWHGIHWPQGRRTFINIPTSGNSSFLMVYGQDAKGWTTYQLYSSGDGIELSLLNETPYYGSSNGKVYTAETGYNDNGQATAFNGRMAFYKYDENAAKGSFKAFKDIRPLMRTKRGLTLKLGLDTNYQRLTNLDTIATSTGTYTAWGSAWGSPWSSDIDYIYDRYSVQAQGSTAAIRFEGSIKDAPLELYGFEVRYDLGGQV